MKGTRAALLSWHGRPARRSASASSPGRAARSRNARAESRPCDDSESQTCRRRGAARSGLPNRTDARTRPLATQRSRRVEQQPAPSPRAARRDGDRPRHGARYCMHGCKRAAPCCCSSTIRMSWSPTALLTRQLRHRVSMTQCPCWRRPHLSASC